MNNNIKNSESYLSTIYDYCLDLVQCLICNPKNGLYDEESNCYTFNFILTDTYIKFVSSKTLIKFPVNEINGFFKIQSVGNIFKKVCNDLGIRFNTNKYGVNNITLTQVDYKNYLKYFNMIDQAYMHNVSENNEELIYQTLEFIHGCECHSQGNADTINFSLEYNPEAHRAVLKNIANSRLILYKSFNMSEQEYNIYVNNLTERLNMLGFTVFNYYNYMLLVTLDINRSERNFNEYYSDGIKLTKRNYY